MPRLYSENEAHVSDWVNVPFENGVAAVAAAANVAYFTANDYTVDQSKHTLMVWDRLTVAEIDAMYAYLGGTVDADDTKSEKVRKLETSLSAKYIAEIAVASAAATAGAGKTKLTVTTPGTASYYFKSAETTSPAILYGDVPDATWQKLTLVTGVADEVVPTGGVDGSDDKFTVVRVTAGGTVDAIDKDTLTVKSS
jgi:hypothetical protein